MFSQRMVALYMKIRLAVSSNGMKEHRLFHRRYQSMTDSTKHGVIRPYSKLIFADFLKLTGIMQEVALHIIRAMVKGRCQGGVKSPASLDNIIFCNKRKRCWVLAFVID